LNHSPFCEPSSGSRVFIWLACLYLCTGLAAANARADTPLFESHSVLELSLPIDFQTLCRPRETPDCDYTPTVLEYIDEHGKQQSIPVEIKIRGGWRSLVKNCSAPLLFIRFDPLETADTPFRDQSVLPLTTHCGQGLSIEAMRVRQYRSTWEQNLLKEYLAHRLYNVITDVSMNARLVRMTYPNPDKPDRKIVNYAFFTEHFESVANRIDAGLLPRGSFDHEKLDQSSAARVALFQYMIGNTDWSIVRERNIVLLQETDGTQVPLPYDFDMSGLVDADYAGPAPTLPIDDVRERYYLGFCSPGANLDEWFERYLARKDELLSLTGTISRLDRKSKKMSRRFLDDFFDILESPERRSEQIVNHCQPWPPGPTDHTSILD
jgi:hypothetical protein